MSFEVVRDNFVRTESHIKACLIDVPYSFQSQSLKNTRDLLLKWLDIYRAYSDGYSRELLPRTSTTVIRMLSSATETLEAKRKEIFEAKIFNEAYVLVNEFLNQLRHEHYEFVLAEGLAFELTSIHQQISETLKGLSLPRPAQGTSNIDFILNDIQHRDVQVIYYEQGQYDNVLSWPLLLHEAFHHIYSSERLDRLNTDCPKVSWLQEALTDMYLVNYFGPAYALSLATYLQRYPHKKTFSHPSFSSRIFIALQYLTKIEKGKKLPWPVCDKVKDVFEYLMEVWGQHKEVDTKEVQEQVELVYNTAEQDVIRVISEKTLPFSEFLTENEEKRNEVHSKGGFEYAENQVLSVSDVTEYFGAGMPVAADPRVLFNAFISRESQKMFNDPRLRIFIVESLKKWHIKKVWSKAKRIVSRG